MILCYVQKIRYNHAAIACAMNTLAVCPTTPLALIPAVEETVAAVRKGDFFHRTDALVPIGIPDSWTGILRGADGPLPVNISAIGIHSGLNLPIPDGWNGENCITVIPAGTGEAAPADILSLNKQTIRRQAEVIKTSPPCSHGDEKFLF